MIGAMHLEDGEHGTVPVHIATGSVRAFRLVRNPPIDGDVVSPGSGGAREVVRNPDVKQGLAKVLHERRETNDLRDEIIRELGRLPLESLRTIRDGIRSELGPEDLSISDGAWAAYEAYQANHPAPLGGGVNG